MRHVPLVVFVVATLFSHGSYGAGEDVDQARRYFNAGASAYSSTQYEAAIQAFRQSYALAPRAAILFAIAQAERKQYFLASQLDMLAAAIRDYRRYLAQTPEGGRRSEAVDALSELEPLAVKLGAREDANPLQPEQTKTRIMVTSEASGAHAILNDHADSPLPLVVELKPGQHRVRVSGDGYFDEVRDVTAVQGVLVPVDVPLRELPAAVRLEGDNGVDIYVDGAFFGRTPMNSRGMLPSGSHAIDFVKNGYEPRRIHQRLRRGEQITVPVSLTRTKQRVAATILLAGSAALVATAGVCVALSITEENRAKSLAAESRSHNVDSAALDAYNRAIDSRDSWRTGGLVALGASIATLGTGVALFIFDRRIIDSPPAAIGQPGEPERPRQRGTDLSAHPVLSRDAFGLVVSGHL